MIKINLLAAAKKERKKVGMQTELAVLILSIILLSLILYLVQWRMGKSKEGLLERISKTEQEIVIHRSQVEEINKAKESQKNLLEKLNIIDSLKKQKAISAKILDVLSIDKPERVHFESVKKEGSKLGIEGIALDDETVANFMENLRKSKIFKSVDLVVSEQIEQSKIKLKKFVLTCEIS
jgi:type IV pilus assembly protein PilN